MIGSRVTPRPRTEADTAGPNCFGEDNRPAVNSSTPPSIESLANFGPIKRAFSEGTNGKPFVKRRAPLRQVGKSS